MYFIMAKLYFYGNNANQGLNALIQFISHLNPPHLSSKWSKAQRHEFKMLPGKWDPYYGNGKQQPKG